MEFHDLYERLETGSEKGDYVSAGFWIGTPGFLEDHRKFLTGIGYRPFEIGNENLFIKLSEDGMPVMFATCSMRVGCDNKGGPRFKPAVIVGYESGNQKVLNTIKKGATVKQAEDFTKNAKKAGLKIFGCFMIGLPGDTKESIKKTFDFAKELNPNMAFFQHAVPFPGTEFYEWCKKNGYLVSKTWDDWLDKNGRLATIVTYPELSDHEIKKLRDEMMFKFYSSPRWLFQTLIHNLNLSEIVRLFKAARDYFSYLSKRV